MTHKDNNFWNFQLGQIIHTTFWGSRGIGGGVRENNAYCFLLIMAHLFIFIHNGGIWKVLYSTDLEMVLIFFLAELHPRAWTEPHS